MLKWTFVSSTNRKFVKKVNKVCDMLTFSKSYLTITCELQVNL
jgi:hypothetical protein